MKPSSVNCPCWLSKRMQKFGGNISFHRYMDWVLNDPKYGFYSNGNVEISPYGDFVTSPSMSSDFAELLSIQVADWLSQLDKINFSGIPLTLVELGPGEGNLIFDLLFALARDVPHLVDKLEVIMVERNHSMKIKQKSRLLNEFNVPIYWKTIQELVDSPVFGIVIANEFLDALPVERLVYSEGKLYRQGVSISSEKNKDYLSFCKLPITNEIYLELSDLRERTGINIPPVGVPEGWSTELHSELSPLFKGLSNIMSNGIILIIDYALEARRYYCSSRNAGTIMAYRNQTANGNLFLEPGLWDITSHLCLETLLDQANRNGLIFSGEVRQGQALLSLGLAQRLHSLQELPSSKLAYALGRREALLRLVDPTGLGDFRWISFEVNSNKEENSDCLQFYNRFSNEPLT